LTEGGGKRVLLIGYGNPAREDDGIGPAVAEIVDKLHIPGLTVESGYQLDVEDAADIAEHDMVVFVDACVNCEGPYTFTEIEPSLDISFSSHSVEPEILMGMAKQLFKAGTRGYALGIHGYSFEMFKEEMTERAVDNMGKAVEFLLGVLQSGQIPPANP
jgi:hydrogenase maturation protease